MRTRHRAVLVILILCSCIACDQVTKAIARRQLASSPPISLLGDVIRLQYSENTGGLLGLGAGSSHLVRFWILTVLVGVVLIGLLAFILSTREMNPVSVTAASLIVGGGFGNLVDRLCNNGLVIDFMNIGVGNIRTGIFNLADVILLLGMGILIYRDVFRRGRGTEPQRDGWAGVEDESRESLG